MLRPRRDQGRVIEGAGMERGSDPTHVVSLSRMKPKPWVPTVFSACRYIGDGGWFGLRQCLPTPGSSGRCRCLKARYSRQLISTMAAIAVTTEPGGITGSHVAVRASRRNHVSGSWFRRDMAVKQGAERRLGEGHRCTASPCSPCRSPRSGGIHRARAWQPPSWPWRRRSGTARPQHRRVRQPHLRAPPQRPPSRARRPSDSEGGRRNRGTSPPKVRGRSSCVTASRGDPTPCRHRPHEEMWHSELGSWVS
ncbi:hypothetical protein F4560_008616 [Saccharothrix ecbatanensis]|uniref:Uncharacterized protein n=1 Tax=Saccharothrix ecbatanensis TaxID=1105145 RepID=A0A7W9HUS0_9PSEU|nr:hypothetical protein [Saccharothrix ecbatanensis]